MGKFIDLTGKTFGKWKVIERIQKDPKKTHWLCKCDCGSHYLVNSCHLIGKKSTQCKTCHNKDAVKKRPIKHGNSSRKNQSAEYKTWSAMRTRCNNPNNEHWNGYGGRGIKICKEWDDFNNFFSDMGKKPNKMTLDRIDVNGNYCKENCRWASQQEQSDNKRTNVFLEKNGIIKTKSQWAREYNIPFTSFSRKIDKGFENFKILTSSQ